MSSELRLIKEIKDKMYEAVEGIYIGDCKNLTVGRLEDTFAMLNELEEKLKARIVLAE
jgi:hypothetical protein